MSTDASNGGGIVKQVLHAVINRPFTELSALVNMGAIIFLGWYALTSVLPTLVAKQESDRSSERAQFIQALTDQRQDFRSSLESAIDSHERNEQWLIQLVSENRRELDEVRQAVGLPRQVRPGATP